MTHTDPLGRVTQTRPLPNPCLNCAGEIVGFRKTRKFCSERCRGAFNTRKNAEARDRRKLNKPSGCESCGSANRIEAHHHRGYELEHQLDVQWLCPRCHRKAHGFVRRGVLAVVVAAVFVALAGGAIDQELRTESANAHLVKVASKPSRSMLENRAARQLVQLKHARYVCRHGARANQRWHCAAKTWIRREWNETMNLLRPVTVPAIPEMWHAISRCESGGDWDANTGNGFYGGLQFLTSTWLAYGGGRYAPRADLASPHQQVAVASRMSLSHWPHCGSPYR